MIVGAARDKLEPAARQLSGERFGVDHHLVRVVLETGLSRLMQRDSDRGGRVIVRTSLQPGEDGAVDRLGVLLGGHDHRTARAAQRLVRGRGDHTGVPHGRWMRAAGDEPGDVGDVGREHRSDLRGDRGEGGEVDRPRNRRAAAENDLRARRAGEVAHFIHVGPAGLLAHAILHRPKPLTGHRHVPAVREVPAHGQRHSHDRVTRLAERQVHREVGGRAGVRLHVGVLHTEQRPGPLRRQRLDRVDDLLALVVAPTRVAFRVFVRQDRSCGLEHSRGDIVLRRDQADRTGLAPFLGADKLGDLRVSGRKGGMCGHKGFPIASGRADTQAYGIRNLSLPGG